MTVLNDAIVEASSLLAERPETRKAIVVLSDGMDTYSKASAERALDAALATGASIYTVDMSATDRERFSQYTKRCGVEELCGEEWRPVCLYPRWASAQRRVRDYCARAWSPVHACLSTAESRRTTGDGETSK